MLAPLQKSQPMLLSCRREAINAPTVANASRTGASRPLVHHALAYATIESATAPTTSTRFSAKDDHANTAGTCDSRAQASSHCIVRFFAASSRLRVADATVAWRRPFALV